jgi:hypothetical protein
MTITEIDRLINLADEVCSLKTQLNALQYAYAMLVAHVWAHQQLHGPLDRGDEDLSLIIAAAARNIHGGEGRKLAVSFDGEHTRIVERQSWEKP